MPDVWISFIQNAEEQARARARGQKGPDNRTDLLITPWTGSSAGRIAHRLRTELGPDLVRGARVATSTTRVVARISFTSLIRIIVPLTGWWRDLLADPKARLLENGDLRSFRSEGGARLEYLRFAALVSFIYALEGASTREEIVKLNSIANRIGRRPEDGHRPIDPDTPSMRRDLEFLFDYYPILENLGHPVEDGDDSRIWLVNINRPASQSMFDARKTVKADAAQRVFDTDGKGITIGIIDNGIDATHNAFLDRDEPRVASRLKSDISVFDQSELVWSSRIRATYDFSLLRDLLSNSADNPNIAELEITRRNPSAASTTIGKSLSYLAQRADDARGLDWAIVAPLIQIRHDNSYSAPVDEHGTHVAGILGANFIQNDIDRPLVGICQKISIYDLRVFNADGSGDEFSILSAIEFVGWINRDRDNPVIHGVNLSLALRHDVDSFGCGRTPICDACNQLVGSGVVVVAAAGNMGFDGTSKQSLGNGYRTVSITDPGNAEDVITVGSTHRRDPHAYGVSYFSSRGPTGDGRRKPDILAPGEKITSTVPGNLSKRLDGTSMAAPHVAGAAALLMARYPELIGQPRKIKKILMDTATDLGREAAFQGAGLIDILRALQAV